MLMDMLALLLSFLALRFATRPATEKQTYGFYRLEILAALINGTVLLALSLFIFYEAYQRLVEPQEIKGLLMLGVAVIGLGANIVSALVLRAGSHENLNVKGAFLHVLGDLLSSVGVIFGGAIILLTGWKAIDSILSFIIGGIILIGAYKLVMESVHILLESTPKHIGLKEVVDGAKAIEGVRDLHHVHLWTITSGIYALSAHVLIEDQMTSRSSQILEESLRGGLRLPSRYRRESARVSIGEIEGIENKGLSARPRLLTSPWVSTLLRPPPLECPQLTLI
jgi:cobalt-zinc-cadmium efflux system protein